MAEEVQTVCLPASVTASDVDQQHPRGMEHKQLQQIDLECVKYYLLIERQAITRLPLPPRRLQRPCQAPAALAPAPRRKT